MAAGCRKTEELVSGSEWGRSGIPDWPRLAALPCRQRGAGASEARTASVPIGTARGRFLRLQISGP